MSRSEESAQLDGDLAADEPGVPAATVASWQAAEAQLFTALLSRPDLYQRVVVLVGATVDRLRQLGPSTQALLAAAAAIATVVREAGEQAGLPADAVDPDLVGRSALALRHREVVVEQAVARRLARLTAARSAGRDWVVLEEAGDSAGNPLAPYRRLEVHVATGRALLVTATPDDDFRTTHHDVETTYVDPETGRIGESRGQEIEPHADLTATGREALVTRLREHFSGSG